MHSCCCYIDDDIYLQEKTVKFPAHCMTCSCRKSKIEISHKVRIPKYNTPCWKESCNCQQELVHCCLYDAVFDGDLCMCYECRKVRGRSAAVVRKKAQRNFPDHKYTLLETWFNRFDTDGDGFLDLIDVEALLKYLGARIHNSSTRKILQICDRDCDGRLSFSEFVWLWHRAAHHNEDFIKDIGCPDLSYITKKYKLFSDVHHCSCHEHTCKHITIATERPVQQIKCKCGEKDKVIPNIKHEYPIHSSRKTVSRSKGISAEDDVEENLPTMSKNRDDII